MGFLVKHAGLEIPDPTQKSQGNWSVPCMVTGHTVAALHGHVEFRYGYHKKILIDGRVDI